MSRAAFARAAVFLAASPWLLHCYGYTSECDNPNTYRVLAMASGEVYERRDATIRCTAWSDGCSSTTAAPGPILGGDATAWDCECRQYQLAAGDFALRFGPARVGTVIPIAGGQITITKATAVPTTCGQGDYYMDYSGTFEGDVGGKHFTRGTFYALEVR